MLANLAGIGAVVLIAISLRELRAEHRPTLPIPLLGGLLAAGAAINAPAHPAIVALDVVALVVGGVGYLMAGRRRTRRQRLETAVPDPRRVASISGVGKNPQSVALSPDGRTAYLPAHERGTLAVVDLDDRVLRALIRVGKGAVDALALPDGRRVLVSRVHGRGGGLVVVDVEARQVTGTVAGIRQPRAMATSPDGASVYVPSMTDDRLWRLDAQTLDVTGEVEVGRRPSAVAASPDGTRLYVAAFWSDEVVVLDAAGLATEARIRVASSPRRLAVSGDGQYVYAACADGWLTIIDTSDGLSMMTVRPGTYEGGVDASRHLCYVTDPWEGRLMVLSGPRADVLETIPFGTRAPIDLVAGPDGLLFVACQTGSLDVIRPGTV
jgi:YVTN family beta-propeller protein